MIVEEHSGLQPCVGSFKSVWSKTEIETTERERSTTEEDRSSLKKSTKREKMDEPHSNALVQEWSSSSSFRVVAPTKARHHRPSRRRSHLSVSFSSSSKSHPNTPMPSMHSTPVHPDGSKNTVLHSCRGTAETNEEERGGGDAVPFSSPLAVTDGRGTERSSWTPLEETIPSPPRSSTPIFFPPSPSSSASSPFPSSCSPSPSPSAPFLFHSPSPLSPLFSSCTSMPSPSLLSSLSASPLPDASTILPLPPPPFSVGGPSVDRIAAGPLSSSVLLPVPSSTLPTPTEHASGVPFLPRPPPSLSPSSTAPLVSSSSVREETSPLCHSLAFLGRPPISSSPSLSAPPLLLATTHPARFPPAHRPASMVSPEGGEGHWSSGERRPSFSPQWTFSSSSSSPGPVTSLSCPSTSVGRSQSFRLQKPPLRPSPSITARNRRHRARAVSMDALKVVEVAPEGAGRTRSPHFPPSMHGKDEHQEGKEGKDEPQRGVRIPTTRLPPPPSRTNDTSTRQETNLLHGASREKEEEEVEVWWNEIPHDGREASLAHWILDDMDDRERERDEEASLSPPPSFPPFSFYRPATHVPWSRQALRDHFAGNSPTLSLSPSPSPLPCAVLPTTTALPCSPVPCEEWRSHSGSSSLNSPEWRGYRSCSPIRDWMTFMEENKEDEEEEEEEEVENGSWARSEVLDEKETAREGTHASGTEEAAVACWLHDRPALSPLPIVCSPLPPPHAISTPDENRPRRSASRNGDDNEEKEKEETKTKEKNSPPLPPALFVMSKEEEETPSPDGSPVGRSHLSTSSPRPTASTATSFTSLLSLLRHPTGSSHPPLTSSVPRGAPPSSSSSSSAATAAMPPSCGSSTSVASNACPTGPVPCAALPMTGAQVHRHEAKQRGRRAIPTRSTSGVIPPSVATTPSCRPTPPLSPPTEAEEKACGPSPCSTLPPPPPLPLSLPEADDPFSIDPLWFSSLTRTNAPCPSRGKEEDDPVVLVGRWERKKVDRHRATPRRTPCTLQEEKKETETEGMRRQARQDDGNLLRLRGRWPLQAPQEMTGKRESRRKVGDRGECMRNTHKTTALMRPSRRQQIGKEKKEEAEASHSSAVSVGRCRRPHHDSNRSIGSDTPEEPLSSPTSSSSSSSSSSSGSLLLPSTPSSSCCTRSSRPRTPTTSTATADIAALFGGHLPTNRALLEAYWTTWNRNHDEHRKKTTEESETKRSSSSRHTNSTSTTIKTDTTSSSYGDPPPPPLVRRRKHFVVSKRCGHSVPIPMTKDGGGGTLKRTHVRSRRASHHRIVVEAANRMPSRAKRRKKESKRKKMPLKDGHMEEGSTADGHFLGSSRPLHPPLSSPCPHCHACGSEKWGMPPSPAKEMCGADRFKEEKTTQTAPDAIPDATRPPSPPSSLLRSSVSFPPFQSASTMAARKTPPQACNTLLAVSSACIPFSSGEMEEWKEDGRTEGKRCGRGGAEMTEDSFSSPSSSSSSSSPSTLSLLSTVSTTRIEPTAAPLSAVDANSLVGAVVSSFPSDDTPSRARTSALPPSPVEASMCREEEAEWCTDEARANTDAAMKKKEVPCRIPTDAMASPHSAPTLRPTPLSSTAVATLQQAHCSRLACPKKRIDDRSTHASPTVSSSSSSGTSPSPARRSGGTPGREDDIKTHKRHPKNVEREANEEESSGRNGKPKKPPSPSPPPHASERAERTPIGPLKPPSARRSIPPESSVGRRCRAMRTTAPSSPFAHGCVSSTHLAKLPLPPPPSCRHLSSSSSYSSSSFLSVSHRASESWCSASLVSHRTIEVSENENSESKRAEWKPQEAQKKENTQNGRNGVKNEEEQSGGNGVTIDRFDALESFVQHQLLPRVEQLQHQFAEKERNTTHSPESGENDPDDEGEKAQWRKEWDIHSPLSMPPTPSPLPSASTFPMAVPISTIALPASVALYHHQGENSSGYQDHVRTPHIPHPPPWSSLSSSSSSSAPNASPLRPSSLPMCLTWCPHGTASFSS